HPDDVARPEEREARERERVAGRPRQQMAHEHDAADRVGERGAQHVPDTPFTGGWARRDAVNQRAPATQAGSTTIQASSIESGASAAPARAPIAASIAASASTAH